MNWAYLIVQIAANMLIFYIGIRIGMGRSFRLGIDGGLAAANAAWMVRCSQMGEIVTSAMFAAASPNVSGEAVVMQLTLWCADPIDSLERAKALTDDWDSSHE